MHKPMKTGRSLLWLALGCLVAGRALAQALPWEFNESRSTPNFQSVRGVPISRVAGTPPAAGIT